MKDTPHGAFAPWGFERRVVTMKVIEEGCEPVNVVVTPVSGPVPTDLTEDGEARSPGRAGADERAAAGDRSSDTCQNQVSDTVVSKSAPRSVQDLNLLAHEIHSEYCRYCANVGFDTFAEEWRATAMQVAKLGITVSMYVEAQLQRRIRLDPEDLCGEEAVRAYRRHLYKVDNDALEGFKYCETQHPILAKWMMVEDRPLALLVSPVRSFSDAYRVVSAYLDKSGDQNNRNSIREWYADTAIDEIKSSPSLVQYLKSRFGLDADDVIHWLEGVKARDGVNEASENGGAS